MHNGKSWSRNTVKPAVRESYSHDLILIISELLRFLLCLQIMSVVPVPVFSYYLTLSLLFFRLL